MEVVISNPFSVVITLLIIGAGVAISGYGLIWRSLLEPKFQAIKEQLNAKDAALQTKEQHVEVIKGQVSFLEMRLAEKSHSELAAHIQSLRDIVGDKESAITELNERLLSLHGKHEMERQHLERDLQTLRVELDQYQQKLKDAQTGKPTIYPSQQDYFSAGMRLIATNYTMSPIRVQGWIHSDEVHKHAFDMIIPSGIPLDTADLHTVEVERQANDSKYKREEESP